MPGLPVALDVVHNRRFRIDECMGQLRSSLPEFRCLACERQLTAYYQGTKKRPYFGHKANPDTERCWATSPEGELHIAAKDCLERLLQDLRDRNGTLQGRVACPACDAILFADLVALTPRHRIRVESWGDPAKTLKPDVMIEGDGDSVWSNDYGRS